ncbi:MAG TPA: deoxynucleoside kinase [Candidatus Paceibacterota bacterium]
MYIVLSGIHGIGKTTIARSLARRLSGVYLTEAIDDAIPPPVLGNGGDGLKTQLWFVRQMILKEAQMTDPGGTYVADRGWSDITCYANVVLDEHSRNLFRSIFDHLPKRTPDVQLIVHAPMEIVRERIEKRNRDTLVEWNELDQEYLEALRNEFLSYHNSYKDLRSVYLLDASGSLRENCDSALEILKPHLAETRETTFVS